jgi:hypothetical protein
MNGHSASLDSGDVAKRAKRPAQQPLSVAENWPITSGPAGGAATSVSLTVTFTIGERRLPEIKPRSRRVTLLVVHKSTIG